MEQSTAFSTVSATQFDQLLDQYPSIVADKLADLDKARYTSIPTRVKDYLTKDEVTTLVDWKLSHGKFRPSLRGLVQQNTEELIETTTRDAFAFYDASPKRATDVKTAIITLAKLRGIGPATASLLLSVHDGERVPFFSDELFRWSMFEDGKAKGWDRSIKYNLQEYVELYDRVQSFRKRFRDDENREASSTDIEKVAYVLGKQASSTASSNDGAKAIKSGVKRKADLKVEVDDSEPSSKTKKTTKTTSTVSKSEPTRRSARNAR